MATNSPDLVIAKRLLDHLKLRGFQFQRTAPGQDGPLLGHRATSEWTDTIYIEGFSRDCAAWRQRNSSLIVPGTALVAHRTHGSALKGAQRSTDLGNIDHPMKRLRPPPLR